MVENRVDLVRDQPVEPRDLAAENLRHLALGHPLPRRADQASHFFRASAGGAARNSFKRSAASPRPPEVAAIAASTKVARPNGAVRGAAAVAAGPIRLDRAG